MVPTSTHPLPHDEAALVTRRVVKIMTVHQARPEFPVFHLFGHKRGSPLKGVRRDIIPIPRNPLSPGELDEDHASPRCTTSPRTPHINGPRINTRKVGISPFITDQGECGIYECDCTSISRCHQGGVRSPQINSLPPHPTRRPFRYMLIYHHGFAHPETFAAPWGSYCTVF